MKFLRVILAWLTLLAGYMIVYFLGTIAVQVAVAVVLVVKNMALVVKVVAAILGGGALLGVIFWPVTQGAFYTALLSEYIYPSKNGTRYVVFCTSLITLVVLSFAITFASGIINGAAIYATIFAVCLLVCGKSAAKTTV